MIDGVTEFRFDVLVQQNGELHTVDLPPTSRRSAR